MAAGTWTLEHLEGWAKAGAMVIPFPRSDDPGEVTLRLSGDRLTMNHPEAQAPVVFAPADHEPRWTRGENAPEDLRFSHDAMAELARCDQMKLPRLVGHSKAVVNGHPMTFTFRLMFIDRNRIYGALAVDTVANGMPVISRRAVMMHRVLP